MVSGPLPASWSRLTGLREVTLAGNALTGPLPVEWRTWLWIQTLNLGQRLSGRYLRVERLDRAANAEPRRQRAKRLSAGGVEDVRVAQCAQPQQQRADGATAGRLEQLDRFGNAELGQQPSDWAAAGGVEDVQAAEGSEHVPQCVQWNAPGRLELSLVFGLA
ncbi:hypothetical protein NESM_000889800 [Novymonas esmeraldas]|uniref:Uncharacterized protein n=1 Tax=Novymonas esmeraldas TaxID=1808958 RepID=A0AAW0F1C5_9TRYP